MKLSSVLSFVSWLFVLILWGCAASVYVSPALFRYAAPVGLAFPFCLAAVLLVGAVSLVLRPRLVWISLLGLAGCCGTLRDYFPVNLSSPPPKNSLKLLSYNTMSCGNWEKEDGVLVVPRYICETAPDIACLQEIYYRTPTDSADLRQALQRYGYHFASQRMGGSGMVCMSRFPILRQEVICRHDMNGAVAFHLLLPSRDTLIVINAHLASMTLQAKERNSFHSIIRNPEAADTIHGKLNIVRKVVRAGAVRALQTDTLADFVKRNAGKKLILMGDFNDSPVSYTHHKICALLTDAYRATGNGVGRSFNRDGIYVRIDNIFCSRHFKPYACSVDNTVYYSDHFPMVAYLKPL